MRGRRHTRVWLLAILALIWNLLGGAGTALAAEQTKSTSISMSGGTTTNTHWDIDGRCDDCVPDALASVMFGDDALYEAVAQARVELTQLSWTSDASIDVAYDDQLLRQGQTLDLRDKLTVTGGTMTAKGSIKGSWGLARDGQTTLFETFDAFDTPFTLIWSCPVPLPGESPKPCSSGNANTQVASVKIIDVPAGAVYLTIKVGVSLTANSSTDALRASGDLAIVGGGAPQSKVVEWLDGNPSTTVDSRPLSCSAPAGSDVTYRFTGGSTLGATHDVSSTIKILGVALFDPAVGPDVESPDLEFKSLTNAAVPIPMGLSSGNSSILALGQLAKNNVPPVADAGGGSGHEYAGNQGNPITFDGSGSSSVCGFPSLRWDFSDGGVAFGKNPQHTFQGSGSYSGLVTATDATGLVSSQAFAIQVANVKPRAVAGPGTTAAWGRTVQFNGAGQDPGADDQPTLTYVWEFGDGSPSAAGGASTTHVYSAPGSYIATLTVCDRGGLCDTDTRSISVRKRDVSLGSLGDTAATFDTASQRRASLVDEFGNAVNGRTVTFTVDGAAAGSGVTNASGDARVAWTPALAAGSYATGAAFAGDSLYTGASGSGAVSIAKKATSVAYTGATSGAPNKVVTLSAVLKDATGSSLAGRTITFVVGSQSASAVTDANGVATASLKLSQKNGSYQLSATWAPAGTDAARYIGNAASATFKLQAK